MQTDENITKILYMKMYEWMEECNTFVKMDKNIRNKIIPII